MNTQPWHLWVFALLASVILCLLIPIWGKGPSLIIAQLGGYALGFWMMKIMD